MRCVPFNLLSHLFFIKISGDNSLPSFTLFPSVTRPVFHTFRLFRSKLRNLTTLTQRVITPLWTDVSISTDPFVLQCRTKTEIDIHKEWATSSKSPCTYGGRGGIIFSEVTIGVDRKS